MSTETIRDQFECALKKRFPKSRMLRINRPGSPVDGEYENMCVESAWWAWQESRLGIVIDAPSNDLSSPESLCLHDDFVAAISAHGLSVSIYG